MTAEILAATEHLVLRRMTNDDAAALAAYRSDPVQARYQSWETPYPLDSARALIAQMRGTRRSCEAAMTLRAAPRVGTLSAGEDVGGGIAPSHS